MIDMNTGPLPLGPRAKHFLYNVVDRLLWLKRTKPQYLYILDDNGTPVIIGKFNRHGVSDFHVWLSQWAATIHQQGRAHAQKDA